MQSVNSCQSCILGMAEPLVCGCVDLRDTNTPDSSSLAGSAAQELSELCLPLLWRGYFFVVVLLYANKVAGLLWVPLPVNKRGFLAL